MMVARSRTRTAGADIINLQPHEVAPSELAVDGEIEQSEIARSVPKL